MTRFILATGLTVILLTATVGTAAAQYPYACPPPRASASYAPPVYYSGNSYSFGRTYPAPAYSSYYYTPTYSSFYAPASTPRYYNPGPYYYTPTRSSYSSSYYDYYYTPGYFRY